jgi:hypothetical protein
MLMYLYNLEDKSNYLSLTYICLPSTNIIMWKVPQNMDVRGLFFHVIVLIQKACQTHAHR